MASGFPQSGLPGTEYASIGARIGAHIIDHLFVGLGAIPGFIVIFLAAILTANLNQSEQGIGIVIVVLGYVVLFAGILIVALYNINKLGKTGMTVGKKMMKIKVVTATGEPLGFGKAFLREFVKWLAGSVCAILLLWPLWDQEKQSLGDKVAGTHVYPA